MMLAAVCSSETSDELVQHLLGNNKHARKDVDVYSEMNVGNQENDYGFAAGTCCSYCA